MMVFKLLPVESTGVRKSRGFVRREGGCSVEDIETPAYPESPDGELLRECRVRCRLALGQAARILGISAAEMSGLEWGRFRFADDADVVRAVELLARDWPKVNP